MPLSPAEEERNRSKFYASPGSLAEQIVARSQSGRQLIQDFCPLAESLEWELGQDYLRERGSKAFISDATPVPFVVNNDGTLSRNAAEVFFASLASADQLGSLEPDINVLELGFGVGLFARYFLDHFRNLCARHRKDYYDRLCYIAADRSKRMVLDLLRHGVLAHHRGRYRVRVTDALNPEIDLPTDIALRDVRGKPFRAVFLNYLLDCLPAAVLDLSGAQPRQLCVRTCVARNVRLSDYTDLTIEQLQDRAKVRDQRARQELLEVYGLFASEYDYRPVDMTKLPLGEFALNFGRRVRNRILHSYGAIQSLEKLLGLITEDGFILVNDYGPTHSELDDDFEHQRFSLATFVGVNFPQLRSYFAEQGKAEWLEPGDDGRGIHSRLLGKKLTPEARLRFAECFSAAAFSSLQQPIERARDCARIGRFELATAHYQEAIRRQPGNWVLLSEVSTFLTFQMRDPKAGADMAKLALALNPTCSSDLWCTLGDALFELGRNAEARSAYLKALAVNSSDVRGRYNPAWVHTRQKNYPAALQRIAEALALDKMGTYRDRLLQKQQEVIARMTHRHQQEYLLLINLVSKFAKPDGPNDSKPPESAHKQQGEQESDAAQAPVARALTDDNR